jgi:hypothetical protein
MTRWNLSSAGWRAWVCLAGAAVLAAAPSVRAGTAAVAPEPGVALAIVYDTSGSMADPVRNAAGREEPKYRVASRALATVFDRLAQFASPATNRPAPKLSVGVFVFRRNKPAVAVPLQPFDAAALRRWLAHAPSPESGTPLGDALTAAARTVRAAPLSRRHILFITDGENTVGPAPEAVLLEMTKGARARPAAGRGGACRGLRRGRRDLQAAEGSGRNRGGRRRRAPAQHAVGVYPRTEDPARG